MAMSKTLKVLYHIHPRIDTLDFTGPLEILTSATYTDTSTPVIGSVFAPTITAVEPIVVSNQKASFNRDIPLTEAYANLAEYDVLVIPGGNVADPGGVLEKQSEPLGLVRAFANLPKKADGSIRILFSVCTGSLILASAGILNGQTATTHPRYCEKIREICSEKGKTTVVKDRFVVNKVDEGKGLRIVTAGGVSSGLDASIWLVKEVAGQAAAETVADNVQYAVRQGLVL